MIESAFTFATTTPLLAQEANSVGTLGIVIRIIHVFAAATVIGAVIFQRVAVHPAMAALDETPRRALREQIVRRWRAVVYLLIALLLVTGLINFMVDLPLYRGHEKVGVFHGLFGVKLLAALAVFHAATVLTLPGEKGEKYRTKTPFWLSYMIVLFVLLVVIGGILNNFTEIFGPVRPPLTNG